MYGHRLSWIGMIALCAVTFSAWSASAGPIEDIPPSIAESLGISETAAEMILSASILLSVGLFVGMLKFSNMAVTAIILLAFTGMLTAIGWLDGWLIVMAALIIALFFGAQLRDWGTSTFQRK